MSDRFLTLKDAAVIAACSDDHLRNEWRAHRLSLVRLGSRKYRVRESELQRWMSELPDAIPN